MNGKWFEPVGLTLAGMLALYLFGGTSALVITKNRKEHCDELFNCIGADSRGYGTEE